MAAIAHSVLFMMLALTSVIALHSTSRKRTRVEDPTEDRTDTMETEPPTQSGADAQWHQLNNLIDARLSQMSTRMKDQMTELRKEVKNEVAELSNNLARIKRRTVISQNIRATERACSVDHAIGYHINTYRTPRGDYFFTWMQSGLVNIQLYWDGKRNSMSVFCTDYKTDGRLSGPTGEIQSVFSDVLPFPNLFNKLKKAFDPEMTAGKCIDLIMDIEFDRPGGIPQSDGWVKSFVRDNMDKFLRLVRERGGGVEKH
ncbi:hypothetical protein FOZ63_026907 [Perkinsus olseni]|uniref:Uncharacterized protein n=1 Tax=Perkinsus olseni TaxID=32597 RepID=A0A7J6P549_PEROL|nr:hypothetical protein FOZ60_015916 [Perkinsus olseni]KAF4702456.1 hypothetical protein FOZ62_003949 [Perkinsus olseni]KAF4752484.1 hypothetical protein FOZ63_026907 [Perkinsus olseni]